jgi:integrase
MAGTEHKKRKRGQGEGSIYKRKDGRWAAVINLGYQDGKLRRKAFYGATREEVKDKLVGALNDQQKGLPILTERQTLAQFLEQWLDDVSKPSVRPKTYRFYQDHINLHIKPALGKKQIEKLTPADVQQFVNDKLQSGLSPQTIRHIIATLRAALGIAVKWQIVHRNVAALVSLPRIQKQEMKVFTPEQAKAFLDFLKGHRLEALFVTALSLGLRRGELLGLHWSDIDLDTATLRVNYGLQRFDGKLHLVEPKTEKSRRVLPLPSLLIAALRTHRVRQLEERLALGADWQETGFVFTSTIGTPLEPRNINRTFDALIEKANKSFEESDKLPKIRFHDLRHSCATLLLSQGVPQRTLMEILGHSQLSLTMNTYSHVLPEMTRAAVGFMDAVLGGKK